MFHSQTPLSIKLRIEISAVIIPEQLLPVAFDIEKINIFKKMREKTLLL